MGGRKLAQAMQQKQIVRKASILVFWMVRGIVKFHSGLYAVKHEFFQATKAVINREAPGLAMQMISKSLEVTPMAMLSRLAK